MINNLFLLLIISIIALCSCSLEESKRLNVNVSGTTLSLNELRKYVPVNYFSEDKVVFKHSDGREKTLSLNTVWGPKQLNFMGNQNYNTETFEVVFYDALDSKFNIVYKGTASYIEPTGEILYAITSILMPAYPGGSVIHSIRIINGKPLMLKLEGYLGNFTLNNRQFEDVYQTKPVGNLQYSELDINFDFGVIGFRDAINELWVFDRFEE